MNNTSLFLLGLTAGCATHISAQSKPNIIYILADDLGRAELNCYGQQLIETPHLDKLAQEGMTFSNHYSGQAVSAPSRCVLFTGLHTGHAYIRGNVGVMKQCLLVRLVHLIKWDCSLRDILNAIYHT